MWQTDAQSWLSHGGSDRRVWSNGGMMIRKKRTTCSSPNSSTTLALHHSRMNSRIFDEKSLTSSEGYIQSRTNNSSTARIWLIYFLMYGWFPTLLIFQNNMNSQVQYFFLGNSRLTWFYFIWKFSRSIYGFNYNELQLQFNYNENYGQWNKMSISVMSL
jgi:hypothetical protein